MTISSEINKSGPYNGNGSATDFEFDFKISEPTHLLVLHTNSEGAETQLSADAYQVTQDEDGTGHITLPTALPNGEKITLLLNPPFTQLSDLPNQGAWNPEVVESALDKLTSCLLKLREEVSRSVKIKASNDLADLDELLADIERLADASDGVKALVGVKAKLVECADNIASIQAATTSATNAANSAATALNAKTQAITAKDQSILAKTAAEAARDAAQAAQPISTSVKGRELVAKATEAEMRTVLGAASAAQLQSVSTAVAGKAAASHNHGVADLTDVHSNINLATGSVAEAAIPAEIARTANLPNGGVQAVRLVNSTTNQLVTAISSLTYSNSQPVFSYQYKSIQVLMNGTWHNISG